MRKPEGYGTMNRQQATSTLRNLRIVFFAATAALAAALVLCALLGAGRLTVYLPEGNRTGDFRPDLDFVEIRPAPDDERQMVVSLRERGQGRVFIDNTNADGSVGFVYVRVFPGGMIYNMSNGNFSGSRWIATAVQAYVLIVTVLSVLSFVIRCRTDLFSETTLYMGGTMLFLAGLSVDLILNVVHLWMRPENYFMMNVYSSLKSAGRTFMLFTLPFMLAVSIALAVSNVSLLRREGRKFTNLLAVLMSVLILCGYVGFFLLDSLFSMGSEFQMRIYGTITSVYTTVFVYLEAMLISAMMCGLIAAVRKPAYDKTHIVILGCAIASDGTPLPLLRGRIEKAVSFAKEQRAAGGGGIRFVPSGGKGPSEAVSEAESMKNYLLKQGIGPDCILPEDKSSNTQENMRFSLEKIRQDCPEPKIAFSTSGYHVLRSGMISKEEGLDAEGVGSRTKWYFWPNAFIREFVGLLSGKWKRHVLRILFFIAVFSLINMIIPM